MLHIEKIMDTTRKIRDAALSEERMRGTVLKNLGVFLKK